MVEVIEEIMSVFFYQLLMRRKCLHINGSTLHEQFCCLYCCFVPLIFYVVSTVFVHIIIFSHWTDDE